MIWAIVTDIEGTTSSLSFVKDVLFPYAREHPADFVHDHGQEAAVRSLLTEVSRTAGRALSLSDDEAVEQLVRYQAVRVLLRIGTRPATSVCAHRTG